MSYAQEPASIPHGRRAFTLIELMVVVGIIGVLMGLLIPNMAAARERARAMVCATNLKTIHTLTHAYTIENDAFYMFGVAGSSGNNPGGLVSWDNMLASYDSREDSRINQVLPCPYAQFSGGINPPKPGGVGKVARLYVCPSDGDNFRNPATVSNGSYYTRTYAINGHWGDAVGSSHTIFALGGVYTANTSNGVIAGSLKTSSVENPSTTLEFASSPGGGNVLGDINSSYMQRPSDFNGRNSYTDTGSYLPDAAHGMTGLHGGYLDNVLYCDGHVEFTDFRMTVGRKGIAYGATGNPNGVANTSTYLSSPSNWALSPNFHYYAFGAWTRVDGD